MGLRETSTLAVSIDADFDKVGKDLADPTTHPAWAHRFFAGPAKKGANGDYEVNVPMMGGACRYRVEADLERGLFDLFIAPEGQEFGPPIPVRLLRNGSGTDVLWTLARFPGTPDGAWAKGLQAMGEELEALKNRHEAKDAKVAQ